MDPESNRRHRRALTPDEEAAHRIRIASDQLGIPRDRDTPPIESPDQIRAEVSAPTPPVRPTEVVASFTDDDAARAVDALADDRFPVERLGIVASTTSIFGLHHELDRLLPEFGGERWGGAVDGKRAGYVSPETSSRPFRSRASRSSPRCATA